MARWKWLSFCDEKRSSKEKMWCDIFHLMTLACVLGGPVYSVHLNGGSAIREFLYTKMLPCILDQGAQDTVYIMWTWDEALDSAPGRYFQPNHFIPIFRVPPLTDSNLRISGANQGLTGSKQTFITSQEKADQGNNHQPFFEGWCTCTTWKDDEVTKWWDELRKLHASL